MCLALQGLYAVKFCTKGAALKHSFILFQELLGTTHAGQFIGTVTAGREVVQTVCVFEVESNSIIVETIWNTDQAESIRAFQQ